MSVAYIAYIDESGDDGLSKVKPKDVNGASEWFVLGAVVVAAKAQREATWVNKILTDIKLHQRRVLHFQPLDPQRQIRACEAIAKLPVRCFAVVSNKLNMRGHSNPKAARVSYSAGRTYFYWWMTRLLLERITDYCERRSLHEFGEPRLVRVVFSQRGGLRYGHCQGYLYWIRQQSKTNTLFIKKGDLKWSVINPLDEIRALAPATSHGLQIADSVAGAFYQAANGSADPAIALAPRMAFDTRGSILGYGLKLMPDGYLEKCPAHQRPVFEFYSKQRRQDTVP
ncbi:MAG: DUF3800 domain-containing protein [Hyphomicrobiales bacterium]|nr:DUF3800 domain-containing protein [Hyphomicrobiales bacterium]